MKWINNRTMKAIVSRLKETGTPLSQFLSNCECQVDEQLNRSFTFQGLQLHNETLSKLYYGSESQDHVLDALNDIITS